MDITAAMNYEFRCAKRFRIVMLILQAVIAALSLAAVGRSELWLSVYGIVVLMLGGISLYLKKRSDRRYQKAEDYRRLLFFSKSQNEEISPHELGTIFADYRQADQKSLLREDEYYDSEEVPGYKRMLENLQESAFYTRKLAGSSEAVFRFVSLSGLAIAFFYLLYAAIRPDAIPDVETTRHAAEISTRLVAFAVLGTYVDLWSQFSSLASIADRVFHDSSNILEKEADASKTALKLVSAYDCALAASGPIPTAIWRFHKDALNKGWDHIKSRRSRKSGGKS